MRFLICDSRRRRRTVLPWGFIAALFLASGPAFAQSGWTLTTSDFNTRAVNLVSLDDAGAKVTDPAKGNAEAVVPWQQVLQLQRTQAVATAPAPPTPATKPAPTFTLHLANGDRLSGQAQSLEGETLAWTSRAAGRVDVKLKQVTSIVRGNDQPPRRDPQAAADVVSLTNGDAARGLISAVDVAGITVQAEGTPVTVPWDAVRSVVLAAVAAGAADAKAQTERGVRVTLGDGSVLSGSTIAMTAERATLGAGDAKREVAASAIVGVEQVNGPVAWLSSLPLAESVQTPFFETVFPARRDRTVGGDPIRFGDRTFPRGIGVHAQSRLAWQLPGGDRYKTFRTRYAIDGDKPYANVTVRVKLDDKVVHEAQDFVAGKLADVVQVPLGVAKTLTLEVDYGKNYDVQDRFNWIEPALLAE